MSLLSAALRGAGVVRRLPRALFSTGRPTAAPHRANWATTPARAAAAPAVAATPEPDTQSEDAYTEVLAPWVASHTVSRNTTYRAPGVRFAPRSASTDAAAAADGSDSSSSSSSTSGHVSDGALSDGAVTVATGGAPQFVDSSEASSGMSAAESDTDASAAAEQGVAASGSVVPDKFAVIALGGTQYKVTPGDVINAEYMGSLEVGATVQLHSVLAVGSKSTSVLGRPVVPHAYVTLAVEEQTQDAKVIVFKKKRRKRYTRTHGHRRLVTRLRVQDIVCDLGAY